MEHVAGILDHEQFVLGRELDVVQVSVFSVAEEHGGQLAGLRRRRGLAQAEHSAVRAGTVLLVSVSPVSVK